MSDQSRAPDLVINGMESRSANNGPVRIHYLAGGSREPIIFLHGFPDFSGGWHRQIAAFRHTHRVIVPDLRGFNLSDKPAGVGAYAMPNLVADVLAVLAAEGIPRASIVGHDWGGVIAWWLAAGYPAAVERLVVLSTPHPADYGRALLHPENAGYSAYIRRILDPAFPATFEPDAWVETGEEEPFRTELRQALARSNAESIANYYRASVSNPGTLAGPALEFRTRVPVLAAYAVDDRFVPPAAFTGLERRMDGAFAVLRLPQGGHFLQRSAADLVSDAIAWWLGRPRRGL